MDMVSVQTSELSGRALEWAVAKAAGLEVQWFDDRLGVHLADTPQNREVISQLRDVWASGLYAPLQWTFWKEVARLREFHGIPARHAVDHDSFDERAAATCRDIVAAALGEAVQVPASLVAA